VDHGSRMGCDEDADRRIQCSADYHGGYADEDEDEGEDAEEGKEDEYQNAQLVRLLCAAAAAGSVRSVKSMLAMLAASSVDVNAHDESGVTALHHAARAGSVKSIQALLQAGADVDPPNVHPIYHVYSAGPTPLIDAVKNGELAAVKALLKAGADLGCEDERNMTALAHAEHRRDIKCANALRAADKEQFKRQKVKGC
jgi:ankyrin repeat protein